MRSKFFVSLLTVASFALSAWAHHSHGAYVDTFMDIQGVVTDFQLVCTPSRLYVVVRQVQRLVPHSCVYLELKSAKGETDIWALEAPGRTSLERLGLTATTVS